MPLPLAALALGAARIGGTAAVRGLATGGARAAATGGARTVATGAAAEAAPAAAGAGSSALSKFGQSALRYTATNQAMKHVMPGSQPQQPSQPAANQPGDGVPPQQQKGHPWLFAAGIAATGQQYYQLPSASESLPRVLQTNQFG